MKLPDRVDLTSSDIPSDNLTLTGLTSEPLPPLPQYSISSSRSSSSSSLSSSLGLIGPSFISSSSPNHTSFLDDIPVDNRLVLSTSTSEHRFMPTSISKPETDKRIMLSQLLDPGHAERHYRLGEYVGKGEFGKVHCGGVVGDGENKIVIKAFSLVEEERRLTVAIRELKVLMQVNHKGVVKMHSARLTANGNTIYIVMWYVPGFDLHEWIIQRADRLRKETLMQEEA